MNRLKVSLQQAIDAGQAWEVASRDRSSPTGAFCQFVPPAGTRAGLSQRDNLHLWQRSRTPFYFIFIFFVRFSAPRTYIDEMPDMDDMQLLREYARGRSEQAFTTL